MPASLLESQLKTLEEPTPDEHPITVCVESTLQQTVAEALAALPRR